MADLIDGTGASLYDQPACRLLHHVNQKRCVRTSSFTRDKWTTSCKDNKVDHHRRVHRSHDGRPALLRKVCTRRWKPRKSVTDPERKPDAGLDHLPELFPALSDKLAGMTGTADDRSGRIRRHLRTGMCRRDPHHMPMVRKDNDDEVYRTAAERKNNAIIDKTSVKEVHAKARPAGAGGHGVHRKVRKLSALLKKRQGAARGAQRPLPRAGSHIIAQAGRAGRGDHRHQHGRPRHRHPARRQCYEMRLFRQEARRHPDVDDAARRGKKIEKSAPRSPSQKESGAGPGRPLHHRHRTARKPPYRQPAARPLRAVRATRGRHVSSCRSKTI